MTLFPSKSDIGSFICNPITGNLVKKMVPILKRGGLFVNLSDSIVTPQIAASIYLHLLERSERKVLKLVLPRNVPVIELGSGHGSVSMEIAEHIEKDVFMLIVEANPHFEAWWRSNIECSSRKNINFLSAAAATSQSGYVSFAVDSGSLGSHVVNNGTASIDVRAFSISEIVDKSGFQRFSLVCDIEGEEFSLLEDNGASCFARCDAVVCEIHPSAGRNTESLIRFFDHYGLIHTQTRRDVYGFQRSIT